MAVGPITFDGKTWELDGDRWVDQALVQQYGSADDIPWGTNGLGSRAENSVERSDGVNRQASQDPNVSHAHGDYSGPDPGGWLAWTHFAGDNGIPDTGQANPVVSGIRYGHIRPYGADMWADEGPNGIRALYDKTGKQIDAAGHDMTGFNTPEAQARQAQVNQIRSTGQYTPGQPAAAPGAGAPPTAAPPTTPPPASGPVPPSNPGGTPTTGNGQPPLYPGGTGTTKPPTNAAPVQPPASIGPAQSPPTQPAGETLDTSGGGTKPGSLYPGAPAPPVSQPPAGNAMAQSGANNLAAPAPASGQQAAQGSNNAPAPGKPAPSTAPITPGLGGPPASSGGGAGGSGAGGAVGSALYPGAPQAPAAPPKPAPAPAPAQAPVAGQAPGVPAPVQPAVAAAAAPPAQAQLYPGAPAPPPKPIPGPRSMQMPAAFSSLPGAAQLMPQLKEGDHFFDPFSGKFL